MAAYLVKNFSGVSTAQSQFYNYYCKVGYMKDIQQMNRSNAHAYLRKPIDRLKLNPLTELLIPPKITNKQNLALKTQ